MRVRRWDSADRPFLVPLLHAYLQETNFEYDYRPEMANAEFLFGMGMDPHGFGVIAEDGPEIIGFTNWIHTVDRFKWRICYGMGSYVAPAHRRKGIAEILHNCAAAEAKAAGYEYCDRIANGGMGEPMLNRNGWEPAGTLYRRKL